MKLKLILGSAANCCLNIPKVMDGDLEGEAKILFAAENCGVGWVVGTGEKSCGTDSSSVAIFGYKGEFWSFEESEDYTGHGCQCSSSLTRHKSLENAIRFGVVKDEEILKLMPPKLRKLRP